MTAQTLLNYVSFFLAACISLGSILAYRRGNVKSLTEIQDRVRLLLETEAKTLREQVTDCQGETVRLWQIIDTLQVALKPMGITVTIEGDIVTITDRRGRGTTSTVRKRISASEGKDTSGPA